MIYAQWIALPPTSSSGVENMAMDEALLTWLTREKSNLEMNDRPELIVRTYRWSPAALSLGAHQRPESAQDAYHKSLSLTGLSQIDVVKRPTGGRAIWHSGDISFAMVTTKPDWYRMKLADSYCVMMTWVREALEKTGVGVQNTCEVSEKAYTGSSLCFETQTPSDLLDSTGQKLAGAAQLRRHGGILQHGSIASSQPQSETLAEKHQQFHQALLEIITEDQGNPLPSNEALLSNEKFQTIYQETLQRYKAEAASILIKLSTTSGSHLVPASD